MKKSHTIELPDGRLVVVEGGDAESVANVIRQRIDCSQILHNVEEALELPAMNFKQSAATEPLASNGDEQPLQMPQMKF